MRPFKTLWGGRFPAIFDILPLFYGPHFIIDSSMHAGSARFIALLTELPITIEQESPERMMREILALAREHQISSYDASYLDLAMRKGVPIATLDDGLIKAAERSQVPIMKRTKDP